MLFLSTIFFVLTFVPGKTTKVEINSGNRQNFVLSADEDEIFADFKEFLKSGKATEKSLIDWALINGCKIVVGELQNKFKYEGSDCSANISQLEQKVAQICNQKIGSSASILADKSALIKMAQCVLDQLQLEEQQIQNALANGQNAKRKVALFEFGTLIKAFLNELPEEWGKNNLVKLLNSKKQLLPSDLIDALLNKLSLIVDDGGRIGTEKSEKFTENLQKRPGNFRKSKQLAQRRKRREGLSFYDYIKMIVLLALFGQVSIIAFLLLLLLLPIALQRPKPE